MLVLTRKIDQGIVIAGNIYVRVLGVERDRVKIGISAPMEVSVLRQELLNREEESGQAGKATEQGKKGSTDSSAPPAIVTREEPPANDS